MTTSTQKRPMHREERFVTGLLERLAQDKGLGARLRRADNPATEYQSWETLAAWGVNLENERERLAYATVAAAMARAKYWENGSLSLGQALAACYENQDKSTEAQTKLGSSRLRRLLACTQIPELCRVLRPILTLIESRVTQPLDYVRLLRQIRSFHFDPQRIKAQWAQEYYGQRPHVTEATAGEVA